ncbi:hypothetical protein [Streptomyces sp. MZ04]|uniref:hypothetical protein n=1 Tax=Streptomyces sp. MZ04 TaxID=2559236 RepID=UPI00107EE3AB|nr:hypothetical protein [Streptomyces sp. MZ04]TGB09447.1 hypothetical protein E2651_16255 [Streptomyces sp. MZ04]
MRRTTIFVLTAAFVVTGCGTDTPGGKNLGKESGPSASSSGGRLSWTYDLIGEKSGALTDMAAMAPDDIWAMGSDTPADQASDDGPTADEQYLLHYDGKEWKRRPMPLSGDVVVSRMESLGSAGIWLNTMEYTMTAPENPRYALWDGERWGPVKEGPTGAITDVEVIAPDDVWVLEGDGDVTHWDGARWTPTPMPAEVADLSGTSGDDVWAVGHRESGPGTGEGVEESQPAAMHFDGTAWKLVETPTYSYPDPVPAKARADLLKVNALSKEYAYTSGHHSYAAFNTEDHPEPPAKGIGLVWDGSRWAEGNLNFQGACPSVQPLARDGDDGLFLEHNWHVTQDGTCTRIKTPRLPNTGGVTRQSQQKFWPKSIVPVPGTDTVLAVGHVQVNQTGNPLSKAVVVSLER